VFDCARQIKGIGHSTAAFDLSVMLRHVRS